MRLFDLNLLLEHNVVNADKIRNFINQFATNCDNPNAAQWFNKVLFKHLEQDDHINVPMTDDNRPRTPLPWLNDAINRGDDLRVFVEPQDLIPIFEHLVDYFNWLNTQGDPVINSLDRVLKITVPVAIKKAQDWVNSDHRAALKTTAEGVEPVLEIGSYTWMKAISTAALHRDGAILQNCLGQGYYDDAVSKGNTTIFFLHDSKSQPHVAIRVKDGKVEEIKGKQNQPPVGRYIDLTAKFLNATKLGAGAASIHDFSAMGLVYDSATGKVGIASSQGTVVEKYGDVRVIEVSTNNGHDYWFNTPKDGDVFRLRVTNNQTSLQEQVDAAWRPIIQNFLNNHFEESPSPAVERERSYPSYGTSNKLNDLELLYDYNTKKWGTPSEVSTSVLKFDDYIVYLRGYTPKQTEYLVYEGNDALFTFPTTYGNNSRDSISWVGCGYPREITPEMVTFLKDHRELIKKIFTELDIKPTESIRTWHNHPTILANWRSVADLYYNADRKEYGSLKEVSDKLWSKGAVTLQVYDEGFGRNLAFTKGEKILLEFEWEPPFIPVIQDDNTEAASKILITALNECKQLAGLKQEETYFDSLDVFYSAADDKWTTRFDASKLFHEFDDGFVFKIIAGDPAKYSLFDRDKNFILGIRISTVGQANHIQIPGNKAQSAKHLEWLFNYLKVPEIDLVDARGDHSVDSPSPYLVGKSINNTKAQLWAIGLVFDKRTDKWILLQDGKLVHRGSDYRCVKFRNRFVLVDDMRGVMGWFKAEDAYGPLGKRNYISEIRHFPGFKIADLYRIIADMTKQGQFALAKETTDDNGQVSSSSKRYREIPKSEENLNRQGYGFDPSTGEFSNIEDFYPSETVVQLPKGWHWDRRASHDDFGEYSMGYALSPNGYTLISPDNKKVARLIFDDEHLTRIAFVSDGTGHRSYYDDFIHMPRAMKKMVIPLLEKLDKKLSPTQAKQFGYFRTKTGKYKSFDGHPLMQQYVSGKIDFGDGHVFTHSRDFNREADTYYDVWTLLDENEKILRITLDEDGIESVKYLKKTAKRAPKEFMPYVQKLMKVFAMVSGE